jgi:hypothetical protein
MAELEFATQPRIEPGSDASLVPKLRWNASVEVIPIGRGWDAEPCILDWDGSGWAFLLVTSGGGPVRRSAWLYRPLTAAVAGVTPCFDAGRRVPGLDGLRCICPIPNDRQSRFDLVALDESGLVHLPNEGSTTEPAFGRRKSLGLGAGLGIAHGQIVQMMTIDWDQDGLSDLLVGANDLCGYWPDADFLPPEQQIGLNLQGAHPCYDQDGLWRGHPPAGRIFWLRNVGRPGEPRFDRPSEITGDSGPLDLALHPAPLGISWGGRGSLELMVSDRRGLLRVYRNFGGQLPPVLMEPRTLKCGGAPLLLHDDRTVIAVGDLDGDRRADLVYGTTSGHLFHVCSGPSRNEVKNPAPIVHETDVLCLGGHASVVACDLDGDGDLDLVYGDAAGRLYFVEDLGSGDDHRYALPLALEAGGVTFRIEPGPDGMLRGPAELNLGFCRPAVGDWLAHGRPDLIVTGAGGDVLLLPNDGSLREPRFGHPLAIRCENAPLFLPPRVAPAITAWTAPPALDLIALDLQGFLCAYPITGRQTVGPAVHIVDHLGRRIRLDGGFGLSGRCAIWAGPWTATGKTDLLIGLPRSNRHVVAAASGIGLEDAQTLPTVLLLKQLPGEVVSPRPLRYRDGRPVVAGQEGCCPQGVWRSGQDLPDLLIGSDDGTLNWIARQDLDW